MQQNGWALRYAAPELCARRDIVMSAVTSNPAALEFASNALQADREAPLVDDFKAVFSYSI